MNFPYKLIDLTHTLDSTMPTWSGDCGFNHDLLIDYANSEGEVKFRVMKMKMHAGIGTHMDAPSHCFPSGQCIQDIDINELCMPCVVIDISTKCHENYGLTPEDITEFESKHGHIQKNSCVMVKTGWSKFWDTPKKYHNNHVFPFVSHDAAKLLLERDVRALGIDTLSPDRPDKGFKVHQLFLGAKKIIIENVANLENMPSTNALVLALPIKIKDGTEAPIRLVGLMVSGS